MPTYEYRCPVGHDFEKFYRKISDAGAEVTCPQCGQMGTRKSSAGAALVFKGSGFYITDYGKDGKGPRKDPSEKSDSSPSKESKPAAESKADASPKPESKPASKPEAKPGKQSPGKSSGKAASE